MPISKPRDGTRRLVLGRSGNECAFPACSKPIFSETKLLGELAHIKGNKPGSSRHDPTQDPEERQSAANLLALCGEHADLIDHPDHRADYSVESLTHMKLQHEGKIDRTADRSWIRPANGVVGGRFGPTPVYFWKDRQGRLQLYTDRQLAKLDQLFRLRMLLGDLSSLRDHLAAADSGPLADLSAQSWLSDVFDGQNLISVVAGLMASCPEVTFGQFLGFIVEGNDPTPLLQKGNQRIDAVLRGDIPARFYARALDEKPS